MVLSPLRVRLSSAKDAAEKQRPGEVVSTDDELQAINGGIRAGIVFTMEAKFGNKCCEFRQDARGKHITGRPANGLSPLTWADDNYNRTEDRFSYRDNTDGTVNFFDWDTPGAGKEGVIDAILLGIKDFDSWLSFRGYIVDVCNGNARVGPIKNYGYTASGKYGTIQVTPWGFDP